MSSTDNSEGTGSKVILGVVALVTFALYGFSFYSTSKFLGSADNWGLVQGEFPKIWAPALFGSISLFFACSLYFNQILEKDMMIYFVLGIACLSLCFSYTALAMAVITKSS
jgi:hypothetical protein